MALKQQAKVEVSATQELKLEPALKAKLKQRLTKLKELQRIADEAQAKADKEQALVEGYFEQAEAKSVTLEGLATMTLVEGTSSKLNKKKFVELGGSLAMLENATETKPKKSYVLVTFAKD